MAALPDPSINPPRLPYPGQGRSHSRSPSVSPSRSPPRRLHSISQDPILRNLSPTKTLRVLRNSSPTQHTETEVDLMKSVEGTSAADREFGVRVAQTCKDLREWAVEVEAWEWPGTFDVPPREERASKRRRMLQDHHVRDSYFEDDSEEEEEAGFWGSLPRELVMAYEVRIEEIQQAMDDLDVEGLKNHVRSVHILPKSKSDVQQEEYVSFRVRSVDDFTALITATILQALPYMSWLTRLLNEWSIRLLILRKVPGFLMGLNDTKRQLDTAWKELALDVHDSQEAASPARNRFEGMQKVLGSKVSALGQRLDSMLDELEGRAETLPETWIDRFEALEFAYSNWVVKAERTVTGLAWEFDLPSSQGGLTPGLDAFGIVTEPFSTHAQAGDDRAQHGPHDRSNEARDTALVRRVESPTLGDNAINGTGDDSLTSLEPPAPRLRQDSEFTRLVDDVVAESLEQPAMPEVPAEVSNDPQEGQPPPSPSKSAKSPRMRPRHVPIDVEAYRDMPPPANSSPKAEEDEPYSFNREPPLPRPADEERPHTSGSSVAARRAVFNGDLENKQILLKAQSPVRPFEHASNAFTKLFRPTTSREPSRSRSTASRNTLKKKPTASSIKNRNSFSSKRASDLSLGEPSSSRNARAISDSSERSPNRRSVQEILPEKLPERRVVTAHQNKDWSDKEVVVARPLSEGNDSPQLGNLAKFDSPFSQLRSSGQWPLMTSFSAPREEEISSPDGVIRSDAFEQMFVDTLPTSPIIDDDAYSQNLAAFDDYISRLKTLHGIVDRSNEDALVDGVYNHTIEDLKAQRSRSSRKSSRRHRSKRQDGDDVSSVRGWDSTSLMRSPTSTPEIEHASSAGFFRPQEVNTPRKHREERKSRSRRSKHNVRSSPTKQQRNGRGHRVFIDGDNDADRSASDKEGPRQSRQGADEPTEVPVLSHISNIEAQDRPREVTSKESEASLSSHHDASTQSSPRIGRERSNTAPPEPNFPMPPTHPSHVRSRSMKDGTSILQALRSDSERSFYGHKLGAMKPLPLALANAAAASRIPRGLGQIQPECSHEKAQVAAEQPPATPPKSEKRRDSTASSSAGDYIDQHISKVLKKMTSNIHFDPKSRTATQSPVPPANVQSRTTPAPKRPTRSGFTLAPANPSEPTLKRHVKDGETKLYHLSQPGREQPIKLFVRLVGEDERVMVRVGGGWMDLEDYLRQYAEHHTHRTVSSGSIEVTAASRVSTATNSTGPDSGKKRTAPDSRRASGINQAQHLPARPETALSMRSDDLADPQMTPELAASSPTTSNQHAAMAATPDPYNLASRLDETPPSDAGGSTGASRPTTTYFDSRSSPAAMDGTSTATTPYKPDPLRSNPLFPKITPPPPDSRGASSSRPTSLTSDGIGAGARGSTDSPLSGGPATVRTGLDAQKARWVEDMIARARQSASVGKTKERAERASWAELGRSGGTRRVVMRGGSGDGNGGR